MQYLYRLLIVIVSIFVSGCSILQPLADAYNTGDFLSNNDDTSIVSVTGTGRTQEQAVNNGLDNAIKKVAGVLIVSEQQLKNNKLVKNIQLSYSGGYASGYEIVECLHNDKLEMMDCKMRVKVNKMKVRDTLYAEGDVVVVEDASSSVKTQMRSIEEASEMLRYYFSNIRTTYMNSKIQSVNFTPLTGRNKGMVQVNATIKVSLDRTYRLEVIEFLEQLQKDTGASSKDYSFRIKYGMSFGAGEFLDNTVYLKHLGVNLYNYNHRHFDVMIMPFGECVSGNHLHSGILSFKSETYDYKFYVNANQLNDVENISIQMSDCSMPRDFSWE